MWGNILVANNPKRTGRSYAAQRALIEMAKTMDLALAKTTGRQPSAIIMSAKRLGISTKGWRAKPPQ
jgi:hypothetical protein